MRPKIVTYSSLNTFQKCRKAYALRFIHELVSVEKEPSLYYGSLIHRCLETWYRTGDRAKVQFLIDHMFTDREENEKQKRMWQLATAMMRGYVDRYPSENFQIVSIEKKFDGKIVNPATGASSRSFHLMGRIDGIVKRGDHYYLLEHKTASKVDEGYLERLWSDFQIILYSCYVEQTLGIRITGIIYNVLVKAKLRQKTRPPETDEAFLERLMARYHEPDMFHREELYISREQLVEIKSELWELTQSILDARRRGSFYKNTNHCYSYNKPCSYFQICRSGDNPNVIDNFYIKRAPHQELNDNPESEEKCHATNSENATQTEINRLHDTAVWQ